MCRGQAPREKRHGQGMVPRDTYEMDKQRAESMMEVARKCTRMFRRQDGTKNEKSG